MLFDVLASLQGYELAILMMMIVVFIITLFGSLMLSLLDERIWSVDRTRLSQSRYAMITAFTGFSFALYLSFIPETMQIPVRVLSNCFFITFVYLVMECNLSGDAAVLKLTRRAYAVAILIFALLQLAVWRSPEEGFIRGLMVHSFIIVLTVGSICMALIRWRQLNRIDKSYLLIQSAFLILFSIHTLNFLTTESIQMLALSALLLITLLLVGHLFTSVSSVTYQSLKKVEELSETDWLTGMKNRRYFFDNVEQMMSLAERNSANSAVALLDLDNFKILNDQYGHCVGDQALVKFAQTLNKAIRKHNMQVRWGGEEFLVFFPMASLAEAQQAVDRVLALTRNIQLTVQGETISITASAGVATLRSFDELPKAIAQADSALYRAKDLGKNQLQAFEPSYMC